VLVELPAGGEVIDSITEDQEKYYGFDENDFPEAVVARPGDGAALAQIGVAPARRSYVCCRSDPQRG
jgi:hypothetical protein